MPVPKQLNAWNSHVAQVKAKMPGKSLKEVLKAASATYKK